MAMEGFLQNIIDALSLGSIYALVALGIGLLFGILRLINFAQGDYITIGCYALIVPSTDVTARMLIGAWSWPALIPAICLIVIVAALLTDALVFRPLRRASSPTLMIASFAVSYIIQNGILMIYGSRPKAVNLWSELNRQILVGGLRLPLLQIVTIVITLVLMAALTLFLKRTRVGMQMRASAEDFRMAQYLGVRSNVVIGLAFAISGMLAAVVSFLYLTQSGSLSHVMGVPLALYAFVAVVIGGMGSLVGSVAGGFLVGIIVTFLQAYLPPDLRGFRDAFAFAVVILMLLLRPAGIIQNKSAIERV
jgi:branched-chain amino acid transport system permease protein